MDAEYFLNLWREKKIYAWIFKCESANCVMLIEASLWLTNYVNAGWSANTEGHKCEQYVVSREQMWEQLACSDGEIPDFDSLEPVRSNWWEVSPSKLLDLSWRVRSEDRSTVVDPKFNFLVVDHL